MRRIQIDTVLTAKVEQFYQELFIKHRKSSFVTPLIRLQKLHDAIKPIKHKAYREYVKKVISDYPRLIKADPDNMASLITEFNAIVPYPRLKEHIPYKKMSFWEAVVEAMCYEDLRDIEFPLYLKKEHFKACVYCNAQLTVVVAHKYYTQKKKQKKYETFARLELDHYYPKSKHPFLCTSFYNLYPVCGNCNRSKSASDAYFQLYTADLNKLEVFNFWIDDESVIDYWASRNHEHLKVYFQTIDGDIQLLKNHNDIFKIQGVYDTQSDLAEELIHKALAYSNAYKMNLVDSLKSLFPDQALISRLLIGNYVNPEEIHKRPMAKYTQDLARQLNLI